MFKFSDSLNFSARAALVRLHMKGVGVMPSNALDDEYWDCAWGCSGAVKSFFGIPCEDHACYAGAWVVVNRITRDLVLVDHNLRVEKHYRYLSDSAFDEALDRLMPDLDHQIDVGRELESGFYWNPPFGRHPAA